MPPPVTFDVPVVLIGVVLLTVVFVIFPPVVELVIFVKFVVSLII